jgi:hypothetical protein
LPSQIIESAVDGLYARGRSGEHFALVLEHETLAPLARATKDRDIEDILPRATPRLVECRD